MELNTTKAKVPAFLSNLGKATLRGIRKCPHCGTYNGTRGLSCKNKTCGTVFRFGNRKQPSMDAVKLLTGSDLQVYSVRKRDRGNDHRCLVVLGLSETTLQTTKETFITHISSGRCFAPSCLKATSCGVVNECQHIKMAINCGRQAEPLLIKSAVLNAMQIPLETKQSIWQLANESPGPLIQRVTKSVLAVKCQASQQNSLGYLHASFTRKANPQKEAGHVFLCSCKPQKPAKTAPVKSDPEDKCIHYYACLGAFASDETLAEEFTEFFCFLSGGIKEVTVPAAECKMESAVQDLASAAFKPKMRKKNEVAGTNSNSQDLGHSNLRKSVLKKPATSPTAKRQGCNQLMDESQVSLSFQTWLASVTERIHQTMHYQFDGRPEPLVFHIPQSFFDALQQRISLGSTRKRLPNGTTAFVRKDALPLGTFSKYTWHITSILQVKQIFDTSEMPLEITRSFVQNRDGTYDLFKYPKVEVESIAETYGRLEKQPIRPLDVKTFLKVGTFRR
ncbi:hypothetical protein FKM82_020521 [Ascaphus truei]